jgi:hypothetical protein
VLSHDLRMSRHFFKTAVLMLVSFVILYYGVAWAILRCAHDAEDSDHGLAWHADVNENGLLHLARLDTDVECLGPVYHQESMAGSSSVRFHWLASESSTNGNGFLTLETVANDRASDLGRKIIFEVISPPVLSTRLLLYLFLSSLRI